MQKGVFEVKSTDDNTHLAGEDFDVTLVEYILNEAEGVDLKNDCMAICETASKAIGASESIHSGDTSLLECYTAVPR
jgi:molecular chaperone DnaK